MSASVPGRLAAGGLGVVGGAYAVSKEGFLTEVFPAWLGASCAAARAALQAAPQVVPAANDSAQIELLGASVKTLSAAVDGALRTQRTIVGGSACGTLVLVGAPLAALAYYLRNYGWWVTVQELQEGLDSVRFALCERVEEVRVQLLERIGVLEKQGEETATWQQTQSAAMAQLAGQLQGVHDSVGTLERRLEGVEGDVARSARGVELLCEFVASANAPSIDGEHVRSLQDRLHEFTHQPALPAPPPHLPLPWARPQTGYLTSVLSGRVSP